MTLEELFAIKAKFERARQMVEDLNHGQKQWTLSIPAREGDDPDLVISDALNAGNELFREIERLWAEKRHNAS